MSLITDEQRALVERLERYQRGDIRDDNERAEYESWRAFVRRNHDRLSNPPRNRAERRAKFR